LLQSRTGTLCHARPMDGIEPQPAGEIIIIGLGGGGIY
jgi:hypothetical protein